MFNGMNLEKGSEIKVDTADVGIEKNLPMKTILIELKIYNGKEFRGFFNCSFAYLNNSFNVISFLSFNFFRIFKKAIAVI